DSRLAEKVRYFLSESDFFSRDYEFARIQLRSLERRETSYFANDALKLRIWIQQGLQADSAGKILHDFSDSIFELRTGNFEEAFRKFENILKNPQHPLADNAIVELSSRVPAPFLIALYPVLVTHIESNLYSPLRERMMWERARIAKIIFNSEDSGNNQTIINSDFVIENNIKVDLNLSESDLIEFYEQLILDFPNGFYAPFARQEILNLSEKNI
ncbi:MAG: hypothetical protein ACFCU6_03355, partial [Balneolaceae bacterium]